VEIQTHEVVTYRERIVEKRVEVKGETVERIRVVTRTIWATPDTGTVTQEREVEGSRDVLVQANKDVTVEDIQGTREAVRLETPVLPHWHVALLAGGSLREPLLPLAGPLALGLRVDYRLGGPFWAGAWALSSGQAGLALGVTF
jgi:hypothetical protein